MGKYMRKCKEMGEVAVVEVPPVGGARTRARTLAELKKTSGVVSGELQISYLELRSRRLVKNGASKQKQGEFGSRVVAPGTRAVNSGAGDEDSRVSRCSSTAGSSEEDAMGAGRSGGVWDLEVEVSLGESSADYECIESVRETTPLSDLREESEALESTTSSAFNDSGDFLRKTLRGAARMTPPASEVEEFFASFEEEEQRRFAEKYNYDAVKDIPLAGRYEWVKVTP